MKRHYNQYFCSSSSSSSSSMQQTDVRCASSLNSLTFMGRHPLCLLADACKVKNVLTCYCSRFWSSQTSSGHCWIVFGQARATIMRATRNGVSPTMNYVTVEKPRQCHTSSTLVHWPSLTAVYCAYMKQTRLPSTGWQHKALSTR